MNSQDSPEAQPTFVARVVLAYDGTAAAQQVLLRSEALRRWPDAVFLLVAVLQGDPAGLARDAASDFFPEAAAAERAHIRFILERGAETLRASGFRTDAMLVEGACVDELVRIARSEEVSLVAVTHRPEVSWSHQWWQTHVIRGLIERLPCGVLLLAMR